MFRQARPPLTGDANARLIDRFSWSHWILIIPRRALPVYPFGLPVATVTRIDKDASYAFARIICTPTGGPGQNKEVLVLSRASPPPAAYPEDDAPAQPRAGRTPRRGRQ